MLATEQISRGAVLAGRYRVIRRLGAGGMATVFLAEDDKLGREVAVKRLHTDAPEASLTRFKREARLGAALNHPNLVAVYDTVVADEGALIVMEYVPGPSLADLAARGRMPAERAVPILRSVADALDHAHSQDVVHRDVKPANVLVRDDGVVKLADLGIARAVGATQITSEGKVIGTLPYMAPERLAGPGSGGPESDIYALAAVAFELLSGEAPRDTASTEALDTGEAPDLRLAWPAAPGRSAEVLGRGLDPDPGRRPATATRLVEELDRSLTAAPPAEAETRPFEPRPTEERTAPLGAPPRRPASRTATANGSPRRAVAIAGVAAALIAIAVAIGLAAGSGSDGGGSDPAGPAAKAPKPEPKPEPGPASEAPPAPAAPAPEHGPDGVALNDEGFALLQAGDADGAIPVLQRAVDALEGSGDELTYNYALFNLGTALLRAGRPEEAVPVFEQRLEYPDQTETVQRALDEALAASGGAEEHGPGNPPGHEEGHGRH